MSLTHLMTTAVTAQPNPGVKRHAACDECRTRKLKCSGQPGGCNRCVKQGIICHYSEQKQMGRPRKKPRTKDGPVQLQTPPTPLQSYLPQPQYPTAQPDYQLFPVGEDGLLTPDPPIDPSLAAAQQQRADFTNICPGPIAQSIRDRSDPDVFQKQLSQLNASDTFQVDGTVPSQYPLDISKWPDFSTVETLPITMQPDPDVPTSTYSAPSAGGVTGSSDPDVDFAALASLPTAPACPCLANLYLTLSTISTLSSFPVSTHTIGTLLAAHRTARDVIYCPICPQKFQTGSQNLMLGCTLLNVLADQWHRVKRLSAEEMIKGFTASRSSSVTSGSSSVQFISGRQGQLWRQFQRDLIRAYVFGDKAIPKPPSNTSTPSSPTPRGVDNNTSTSNNNTNTNTNNNNSSSREKMVPPEHTLNFVIHALRRRQRQWHSFDEPTDEFPDRCSEGYAYHHQKGHHHDSSATTKIADSDKGRVRSATAAPFCRVHGTTHRHEKQRPKATSKKMLQQQGKKRINDNINDEGDCGRSRRNQGDSQIPSHDRGMNHEEDGDIEVDALEPDTGIDNDNNNEDDGNDDNDNEDDNDNNNDEDEDEDDPEQKAKDMASDHALCLMIVKYSLDIVANLDDGEG